MRQIVNIFTSLLVLALTIPLLIAFGGIHALDTDPYGAAVAFATSTGMAISLSASLVAIYLNLYSTNRRWSFEVDFQTSLLFVFVVLGALPAITSAILWAINYPTGEVATAISYASIAPGLASLYLVWRFITPVKKL